MKNLLIIIVLFIFQLYSSEVVALDNNLELNKSKLTTAIKYAERFCSAKDNNFFEGLDNEKTLKYSYFIYIGLQNEEIYSKDMYKNLILQIKERCIITSKEEREINEFFLEKFLLDLK